MYVCVYVHAHGHEHVYVCVHVSMWARACTCARALAPTHTCRVWVVGTPACGWACTQPGLACGLVCSLTRTLCRGPCSAQLGSPLPAYPPPARQPVTPRGTRGQVLPQHPCAAGAEDAPLPPAPAGGRQRGAAPQPGLHVPLRPGGHRSRPGGRGGARRRLSPLLRPPRMPRPGGSKGSAKHACLRGRGCG